ncbi:MAG: Fur family transcriptional regulator [Actinomycetota bacterium]|nr:Fur family transcriptional regulator [Actinomycetota bacterium]
MKRMEAAIQNLRASGGRITNARRSVLQALVTARTHVTAEDLLNIVQSESPEIHLSTVYRTLDALEKLGVVDHVHLGHGRAVYHLSDNAHQHIVCDKCSSVEEVPSELFLQLEKDLKDKYRFKVRMNHFAVIGTCSQCLEKLDKSELN